MANSFYMKMRGMAIITNQVHFQLLMFDGMISTRQLTLEERKGQYAGMIQKDRSSQEYIMKVEFQRMREKLIQVDQSSTKGNKSRSVYKAIHACIIIFRYREGIFYFD